jgi:hypothetical protein
MPGCRDVGSRACVAQLTFNAYGFDAAEAANKLSRTFTPDQARRADPSTVKTE